MTKRVKIDIILIVDEKINGELFLELPDDKEFLQDLGLSPAFKRLLIRKAKQVAQQ